MYFRSILLCFFGMLLCSNLPQVTFAQSPSALVAESLQLTVSPTYPEPGQEFTATLGSYTVSKTSVRWFINGVENTAFLNQNSITQTASSIGNPTNITTQVTTGDGTVATKKYTVTPQRVDIIVTSNTLVPPFYAGRTLPSSGSTITATAVALTKNIPQNQLLYTWKVNGKIQNGGGVQGGTKITYVPGFEKNVLLSVAVADAQGKILTEKSQSIPVVTPELYFYEQNPLRGLSFTALKDPYIFIADEMTIRAEGYFMNQELGGAQILRQWKIGGKITSNTQNNPQEITVNKTGNAGSSKLTFHIRNLQQLLQGVEKSITLNF